MKKEFCDETIVAICYDFDKTLSPRDMQEYTFIPRLGYTPQQFWDIANSYNKKYAMDKISATLFAMYSESKKKGFDITAQSLKEDGKDVKLYDGLDSWFKNINIYGASMGLKVEHYIISAGIKEMIEGVSIADNFKYIYASSYHYDENGKAIWPRQIVNDVMKTQLLYRINKGCLPENDENVNKYIPLAERRVRFSNLIFIGDSETDIPCMSVTQEKGGFAVGVYNPKDQNREKVLALLQEKRIDYFAEADYSKGKDLYNIVKKCLERIKAEAELEKITYQQKHNF